MAKPQCDLKEIIRLCNLEPVDWLVGEAKDEVQVDWVVDTLINVSPGDLLILSAEEYNQKFVKQAKNSGAVALLLLGKHSKSWGELPENLPIVLSSVTQDIRTVQRDMLTILVNQRTALMERGVRIHAQLSQVATEGKGLSGLAQMMAGISGRGILIQDKRGRILADYPSSTFMSIWENIRAQLGSQAILPESLLDRKRAAVLSQVVSQNLPGDLSRLVSPITVGEVVRGYLSLISHSEEMDALDQLVADQGALVCAIEMAKEKAVRETEKRLKGDLLTALLQENLSSRDAELWVRSMGLDLDQAHIALRFMWDSSDPPSKRRLETLVNGEISRLEFKAIVEPMSEEVICICQVPRQTGRPEAALSFGLAVMEGGMGEHPDVPMRCGIGTPAFDIKDWRSSFRQAGQALKMARRFGRRNPLYFPDLSVYRLLLQIEHNPELMTFQEETIGALLKQEGKDELIRTLEAFFEHKGNVSRAAKALFIHRNTLIYRLERISEITNLDLDNPETRLAVQLALHIYDMMSPG